MIKSMLIKTGLSFVARRVGLRAMEGSQIIRDVAPYLIVGGLCFAIGYFVSGKPEPVQPGPVTQFLSPGMSQVPNFRSTPTIQFIHTERVDTVTRVDTIRVPHDFDYLGVIDHRPVSVTSRNVYLNYFEPDTGRMITDRYEVPEPRFRLDYGVEGGVVPFAWDRAYVGAFAEVRYRRLGLTASGRYVIEDQSILPTIGLRVYL